MVSSNPRTSKAKESLAKARAKKCERSCKGYRWRGGLRIIGSCVSVTIQAHVMANAIVSINVGSRVAMVITRPSSTKRPLAALEGQSRLLGPAVGLRFQLASRLSRWSKSFTYLLENDVIQTLGHSLGSSKLKGALNYSCMRLTSSIPRSTTCESRSCGTMCMNF